MLPYIAVCKGAANTLCSQVCTLKSLKCSLNAPLNGSLQKSRKFAMEGSLHIEVFLECSLKWLFAKEPQIRYARSLHIVAIQ